LKQITPFLVYTAGQHQFLKPGHMDFTAVSQSTMRAARKGYEERQKMINEGSRRKV
jgi:hypothetical protein